MKDKIEFSNLKIILKEKINKIIKLKILQNLINFNL